MTMTSPIPSRSRTPSKPSPGAADVLLLEQVHPAADEILDAGGLQIRRMAGSVEPAELAAARPGPTAAILVAGLRRLANDEVGQRELASAIRTTGTIELGFLERGLVILATVANVAPLMGFLGTVIGMIIAFASIEAAGDVDATLVAGGIKVALLTTATGLLIAIPVNIGYNFFVTRIDALILDMEQGAQKVLDLAYGRGLGRPLASTGAGGAAPLVDIPAGDSGSGDAIT